MQLLHAKGYQVNKNNWCEYESDLRSNEQYLSSSENKDWKKNLGLYRIWTYDLCDTGVPPTELTSQLEAGHYVGSK